MNKRIKILIIILLFCLLCFVLLYCLSRKNIVSVNIYYSETEELDILANLSGETVQSSIKAYHDLKVKIEVRKKANKLLYWIFIKPVKYRVIIGRFCIKIFDHLF